MAITVEPFLRRTNNLVRVRLTTGGLPLPNLENASQVDIAFADVLISRTSSNNGVDFSLGQGLVVINPAQLQASELTEIDQVPPRKYPAVIRVFDGENPEGAVFGGIDSEPKLMFQVRTPIDG